MTAAMNRRMALVALSILAADQITKVLVLNLLEFSGQVNVIDGFFKLVHWGNTGAAWSLFYGHNKVLAGIAVVALGILFVSRHHFHPQNSLGHLALGLIFGGIVGNLIDRLQFGHVVDFIRFYLYQRGGSEIGFPAFNVADSAICTGVVLLFLLTWQQER